ncbi:metallophosphoesterase [Entomobacter blattae]|uniref:Calcineurin-like phosphoesterase domain-containing protein n=1 Tax=Entomobacter blattae TaxID=2762277 RepID=A0A7H1NNJ4_9PROT|nr:metallophosphoesterase [Entomobacter blattae]QNT77354.1 hypothetical protein JGUZn3_00870 [Entomobacter blattae]
MTSSLFIKSFLLKTTPLRVVGDVHGEKEAFSCALNTPHFVIQLGDLVDNGPNSAGVIELMLHTLQSDKGLFIAGNHERKLARALEGKNVTIGPALQYTLDMLHSSTHRHLITPFLKAIQEAPAWFKIGSYFFVHGGFHPSMLVEDPPPITGKMTPLLARALFGKVMSEIKEDGYPKRSISWVDHIPHGLTLYCGHDQRSEDGTPWTIQGNAGGIAVFLDTGAGKGGHLSWIDLPPNP